MKPEAVLAVAAKSRKQGEQYLENGNPGRAFAHFLVSLKLQPQWKPDLKDSLSTSLCSWGNYLEQQKRYKDLFHCYEQALEVFPENEEVLNNLGAHLFRLGHVREATHFFRKSLSINPEFLPATCNLESMSNLLVERWHFRMLNDTIRNEAYREAIMKKIRQGFDSVLDIGTGTGLLSLFAVDAGASEVYACECSTTMVHIAQQVLDANNMTQAISLIPKMSTDLRIPHDLPSRVSLVVTETMDAGLLGENVLQTLADAWARLLLPPCPGLSSDRAGQPSAFSSRQLSPPGERYGLVVPLGASVWVAALESSYIARSVSVPRHILTAIGLEAVQVVTHREEPYDSEDFSKLPENPRLLSTPQDVLYVNFNDPIDIHNCLMGQKQVEANLSLCEAGRVDGILAWFSLRLDEDILLSSAPGKGSCWEQAIFPLSRPIEMAAGQEIKVSVSCVSGKMSVKVDQIIQEASIALSEDAVRFLNNDSWVEALNHISEALQEKRNLCVLDLCPFPILSLKLLAQGSASKIVCLRTSEVDEKTIKLAGGDSRIQFVTEEDICTLEQQFDVIIVNPVNKFGELDQNVILQISSLREMLKSEGLLYPRKMSVWAQLSSCNWLKKMSEVESDLNVGGYKISEFVNTYKVSQHLGLHLSTLEHTPLCEPICLMELLPEELKSVNENHKTIQIHTEGEANAILYWFELTGSYNDVVSTRYTQSHVSQAAMLLETEYQVKRDQKMCITARQQHGFIHLGVIQEI